MDVNLALGVMEQLLRRSCTVAVLFSHDTDLLPAVETAARLLGASHIETASWQSKDFRQRLRTKIPRVHHHDISEPVFRASKRESITRAQRDPRTLRALKRPITSSSARS